MKKVKRPAPASPAVKASSAPQQAALLGLVAALFALGLTAWLVLKTETSNNGIRLIFGLLLLLALIPSVYAWLTCRPPRREQTLGFARTSVGLVLLMSLFLVADIRRNNGLQLKAQIQSAQTMEHAVDDYQDKARKDFARDGSLGYDQSRAEKLRSETRQAIDKTDGVQNKLTIAGAAYFERMQAVTLEYARAQQAWADARVMDASLYTSREVISQKRAIAVQLQQQNQSMTRFINNSTAYYDEELKKLDLSDEVITEAKNGFRAKTVPRNKIMLEIRGYDEQIFQAVLNILDTLSAHFGEWSVNDAGTVQIADPAVSKQLKDFHQQMDLAGQKQTEAQSRLLELGQ